VKVAETLVFALIVPVQAPVPLHAPPQPAKLHPVAGVAIKLPSVPAGRFAVQVVPQSIPAGLLVTVPWPLVVTESV
jgi:hypothetical protein